MPFDQAWLQHLFVPYNTHTHNTQHTTHNTQHTQSRCTEAVTNTQSRCKAVAHTKPLQSRCTHTKGSLRCERTEGQRPDPTRPNRTFVQRCKHCVWFRSSTSRAMDFQFLICDWWLRYNRQICDWLRYNRQTKQIFLGTENETPELEANVVVGVQRYSEGVWYSETKRNF